MVADFFLVKRRLGLGFRPMLAFQFGKHLAETLCIFNTVATIFKKYDTFLHISIFVALNF